MFEGASFVLEPGFYGLVGANGAGKTTLLRVLARELAPSEGEVLLRPPDANVVVCEQEVDTPNVHIAALASVLPRAILRVHAASSRRSMPRRRTPVRG